MGPPCYTPAVHPRYLSQGPAPELAPSCECGCGAKVKWSAMKGRWSRFLSGHNARCGKNGVSTISVDWQDPRWVYVLGAHLGDGCDHRRLDIAVCDDSGWDQALVVLLKQLGLKPHVGKTIRVRASSVPMMRELGRFKAGGRAGLWTFPFSFPPSHVMHLLAGLTDSDGGIQSRSGAWTIYQRDNGNLERLEALLRGCGETRLHLGRDPRKAGMIEGRVMKPHTIVRLGIRSSLRDELAPLLRNPARAAAWAAYRSTKVGRRPKAAKGKTAYSLPIQATLVPDITLPPDFKVALASLDGHPEDEDD